MTLREFVELHPGEALNLTVSEGRVLLEPETVAALLAGKAVIVCDGSPKRAVRMPTEELLDEIVCSAYRTHSLWRVAASRNPELQARVPVHPGMMRWRLS